MRITKYFLYLFYTIDNRETKFSECQATGTSQGSCRRARGQQPLNSKLDKTAAQDTPTYIFLLQSTIEVNRQTTQVCTLPCVQWRS